MTLEQLITYLREDGPVFLEVLDVDELNHFIHLASEALQREHRTVPFSWYRYVDLMDCKFNLLMEKSKRIEVITTESNLSELFN